jgi:hypothetical protein
MFVSNEAVGSVIGRRGAKINEIRAMSGARINVLESGTKGRGGGGRGGSPEPDRERIIGKLDPQFFGLSAPAPDVYHQAKLVRKILIPTVLWIFLMKFYKK